MSTNRDLPLPQRLSALVLVVGLSCLLVSLGICLSMAWHGTFTELPGAALILPILILIVGAAAIKRSVGRHADIEDQLRGLAYLPVSADLALKPVSGADPIAAGWNFIIDRISGRSALSRLEARLESSLAGRADQQVRDVVEHLPDGLVMTDGHGRVTLANRTARAILGVGADASLDNATVEGWLQQLFPDEAAKVIPRLHAGANRGTTCEFRLGSMSSAGVLRIARHPQRGADGAFWLIRDVTQQKLAEEMRTQFVVTATHELRTPLANIKAYSESLASHSDIDVEQQRQFFNVINSEATRLARFVDELLNISQMEAGALTLATHETDIARLLEEVVDYLQPEIDQKQIRFEQRLPPKIPRLCVDKDKLVASMVNLLGNAIKYTPDEGKVRLDVEVTANDICFHVEDTGIGIADDEQPRLFEKFYRSTDERVQSINGSGLGLAFTQEVARLHGGRVTVHSELNKGSRFTLTLPRIRLQASA